MKKTFSTVSLIEFLLLDTLNYDLITHLVGNELAGPGEAILMSEECKRAILHQQRTVFSSILKVAQKIKFGELGSKKRKKAWIKNVVKEYPSTLEIVGNSVGYSL